MATDWDDSFEYADNAAMRAVYDSRCVPNDFGTMDVVTGNAYEGSKSLRLTYPPPDSEGGCNAVRSLLAPSDTIFMRWFMFVSSNFLAYPDVATKLIQNNCNGVYPDVWWGMNSFGTSTILTFAGTLEGHYVSPGVYTTTNYFGGTITRGQWVGIETQLTMSSPGGSDGILRAWINNVQVLNYTNLKMRGPVSAPVCAGCGINTPTAQWLLTQLYRQHGQGTIWYDKLAVSRDARITLVAGGDSTPPPVPSQPTITSGGNVPLVATWPAVTNPGDLAGYKYYRKLEACAGGGGYSLIATLGNVLTYNDTTIPLDSTVAAIKVSSYDTSGNESALSVCQQTTLTPPAPTERTTLFTENFAGADEAELGPNWDSGYTGSGAFKIVGNEAVAANLNTDVRETNNVIVTPNDQWLQAKLTKFTANGGGGVLLRWANAPTVTGYFLKARPGSPSTRIDKYTNGVYANITGNDLVTWLPGDSIRAEIEGTTLRVTHIRGAVETSVINATDTSFASGKLGLSFYSVAQNDNAFDDVSGGGFAVEGDTFAHVATVVPDANGADLTFTGLAYKIRYWDDLHAQSAATEVTGLGGVASYRLNTTWAAQISFACFEAQGSDGIWETAVSPSSYLCASVTPGSTDTTPPAVVTGLEIL